MAGARRCATSSGGGITLGKSVRRVKMGVNPAGRDLAFAEGNSEGFRERAKGTWIQTASGRCCRFAEMGIDEVAAGSAGILPAYWQPEP